MSMWKAYARIFFLHQKCSDRSGIRTHAHRTGRQPERSALDHSAILTTNTSETIRQQEGIFTPFNNLKLSGQKSNSNPRAQKWTGP